MDYFVDGGSSEPTIENNYKEKMTIQTFRQLKNLPVYTKSNEFLGKVKDVEFNIDSHNINKYIIKSSDMVKRIVGKELLISPSQIINIDEQKMIVEDNVGKENGLINEAVTV